jgi:hypothetical protein
MWQLQRAIDSVAAAPSPADRARLEAKVARWRSVLEGMTNGALTIGSRTPVSGVPPWVTLDVAHGGFASGGFSAEKPLRADESDIAREVADSLGSATDRERVNLWYLTDAGQERLRQALAAEHFRVEVPEDAALLVIAWLLEHQHAEAALDLVSELRPWMDRLRFTPLFTTQAPPAGAMVSVQTAGQAAAALRDRQPHRRVAVMTETLQVWDPLFDRLLALWCDTVEGELPALADGPAARGTGASVTGGWPCRRWPADWAQRRSTWLADYATASGNHRLARRPLSQKSNFGRLRRALERCPADSSGLSGRDVGWIRRALANTVTRHGAPGSPARVAVRDIQAQIASQPLHADLAHVLAARIDRFPADEGLPSVDQVSGEVGHQESATVPQGHPMPPHLIKRAARALQAPVGELIERGIIGSAEVLADVLPQITAQVLAADLGDPQLQALYAQTYAAFRRRRSLLLLNLEHQVRFDELPWIGVLRQFRTRDVSTEGAALQVLEQVTLVTLAGFPQTILPNPLVAEMTTLAARSGVAIPLVEEVAADIFMGTFTKKWRRAAAIASGSLAGTLYARYYDLPGPQVWTMPPAGPAAGKTQRWGKATAEDFAAVCSARAAEAQSRHAQASFVAVNGTVLEQAQILTTHNLAVLVDALNLRERITGLAPDLADRAFMWAVRQLRRMPNDRHASLQTIKNSAYAWRQAIYFLSLCDYPAQVQALARLREYLRTTDSLRDGFGPAVDGLAHIIEGGSFNASGLAEAGAGKRFLGWAAGPHWLLPSTPRVS